MILENTAFAADIALHFPKYFHKLYDKNQKWQTLLESSIGLTLKSNLIDEETSKAINLVIKFSLNAYQLNKYKILIN